MKNKSSLENNGIREDEIVKIAVSQPDIGLKKVGHL